MLWPTFCTCGAGFDVTERTRNELSIRGGEVRREKFSAFLRKRLLDQVFCGAGTVVW
jgi:hypothetical protein